MGLSPRYPIKPWEPWPAKASLSALGLCSVNTPKYIQVEKGPYGLYKALKGTLRFELY